MKQLRTRTFLTILVVFIAIFAFTLSGCTKKPEEKKEEVIKIGAILPLTGDAAQWGKEPKKALELYVEELNSQGGINDRKIQVIYGDSKASPKDGVTVAQKLINIDKVKAIIGPIASTVTLAVAPIVNSNKVILISPASTSHEITEKGGEYVFRTINSDSYEGTAMAMVVIKKYNKKSVGIIGLQDVGVVGMTDSFAENFKNLGGKVVSYEKGKRGSQDFKELILKVANNNPESIYVVGYPKDTGIILKQLKELNVNLPAYSAQPAEDPMVLDIAGDAIEGLIYSSTTLDEDIIGAKHKDFKSKFRNKFGREPGSFAAEAYDAISIIVEGLKNNKEGSSLKDFLYQIQNYNGVSGKISFDKYGDVSKPIVIKSYQDKSPKTLYVVEGNIIKEIN